MAETISTIVAFVLVVLGFSYFLQADRWTRVARYAIDSPHRFLITALVMIVFGLVIVINHNLWVLGWPVVTTIFGWILTIKGASFLVYPQFAGLFANWDDPSMLRYIRVAGVALAVIGAVLAYHHMAAA